ncbi:hypothetical protein B0I35DRAFT_415319 [Stachybotrys elegans]|uniref:Uncharacterized protein n=1 Tax=Stachybotrys elegans TaxID=80388 RepID=A0A8K0SDE0_9HYPO|nr:hypothetical protein B0I35DRAFT_415319 [Stachybotrys elegans]
MQPLLQIAQQLDQYVVQDLYMTLNVVKLAVQELRAAFERHQYCLARAALMACVIVHQVTDMLSECCHIKSARRQSIGSSISAGRGLIGSPDSTLALGHAFQMDDDDRRAMQAVMVQRQVKRVLAVARWLRTLGDNQGKPPASMSVELTQVERRLERMANMLQKEAEE